MGDSLEEERSIQPQQQCQDLSYVLPDECFSEDTMDTNVKKDEQRSLIQSLQSENKVKESIPVTSDPLVPPHKSSLLPSKQQFFDMVTAIQNELNNEVSSIPVYLEIDLLRATKTHQSTQTYSDQEDEVQIGEVPLSPRIVPEVDGENKHLSASNETDGTRSLDDLCKATSNQNVNPSSGRVRLKSRFSNFYNNHSLVAVRRKVVHSPAKSLKLKTPDSSNLWFQKYMASLKTIESLLLDLALTKKENAELKIKLIAVKEGSPLVMKCDNSTQTSELENEARAEVTKCNNSTQTSELKDEVIKEIIKCDNSTQTFVILEDEAVKEVKKCDSSSQTSELENEAVKEVLPLVTSYDNSTQTSILEDAAVKEVLPLETRFDNSTPISVQEDEVKIVDVPSSPCSISEIKVINRDIQELKRETVVVQQQQRRSYKRKSVDQQVLGKDDIIGKVKRITTRSSMSSVPSLPQQEEHSRPSFLRPKPLKTDILQVTLKKTYSCIKCSKTFRLKRKLKKHSLLHHVKKNARKSV